MEGSEGVQGPRLPVATRERRSKLDIVARILEVATDGTTKTNLVYRSNLNFKLVQKYIEMLVGRELLEMVESEGIKLYRTTLKGAAAAGAIHSATQLLSGGPESDWPPIESRWRNPRGRPGSAFSKYPLRPGVLESAV